MGRDVKLGAALVFSSMGKWGHRGGVDGDTLIKAPQCKEAGLTADRHLCCLSGDGHLRDMQRISLPVKSARAGTATGCFPFSKVTKTFWWGRINMLNVGKGLFFKLPCLIDSWLGFLLFVGHALPQLNLTFYWFSLQSEQESSSIMLAWDCQVEDNSGLFQMLSLLYCGIQSRGMDASMQTCCCCKD